MDTIRLPPDFKEFLRLLNIHRVEYLLVGGYAVGYHGHPRATGDLDVWIAINRENAVRVLKVLDEFGFAQPNLSITSIAKEHQILRMGIPPLRIEVLTSISGVKFDECYQDRVVDDIDGIEISIISAKHLKQNKKSAGRNQDLADIDNLP